MPLSCTNPYPAHHSIDTKKDLESAVKEQEEEAGKKGDQKNGAGKH
jgi:hypothetical protein